MSNLMHNSDLNADFTVRLTDIENYVNIDKELRSY
jgi:hypothetical protein